MYSGKTTHYGLPFMKDGDLMNGVEEHRRAQIIENLLRASVLAEGENRVFQEGKYSLDTHEDGSVTVRLYGSPAIRGLARAGLVEKMGTIRWDNLPVGGKYYLYVQATRHTYFDPSLVAPIWDRSLRDGNDLLFLAVLDNSQKGKPQLDQHPSGKATATNLFKMMSSPTNPFGMKLSQSQLTVTKSLVVTIGQSDTAHIRQVHSKATKPLLLLENVSDQPEIASANDLRLADVRLPKGIALTDEKNSNLSFKAISLVGALNQLYDSVKEQKPESSIVVLKESKINGSPIISVPLEAKFFSVRLTLDRYLISPVDVPDGKLTTWRFVQDEVGGHKVKFDSMFRFGKFTDTEISQEPKSTSYLMAVYNDVVKAWDVVDFVVGCK